jgi:hypothetical protein
MGDNMKRFICLVIVCLLMVIVGCKSNVIEPTLVGSITDKVKGTPKDAYLYADNSSLSLFTNLYINYEKDEEGTITSKETFQFGTVIKEDSNGKELWRYPTLNSAYVEGMQVFGDKIVLTSYLTDFSPTRLTDNDSKLVILNSDGSVSSSIPFPKDTKYQPYNVSVTSDGKFLVVGSTADGLHFIAVLSSENGLEAIKMYQGDLVFPESFQAINDTHYLVNTSNYTENGTSDLGDNATNPSTMFTEYIIDKGNFVVVKTWDTPNLSRYSSTLETEDTLFGYSDVNKSFIKVHLSKTDSTVVLSETKLPVDSINFSPDVKKIKQGYLLMTAQTKDEGGSGASSVYEGHAFYLDNDGKLMKDVLLPDTNSEEVAFASNDTKIIYVGAIKAPESDTVRYRILEQDTVVSGFLNNNLEE